MKLLLHMCCGPCAVYPYQLLKNDHDITGLFYNPNIHPFTENKKRMDTAREFADKSGFKLIAIDEYNLDEFLRNAAFREVQRCIMCYADRLFRAASVAKKGNFDAFTTTLLVSPFQKHDLIKKIGEEAGEEYGVQFLYQDFRGGFKEGVEKSKQLGLYRQQYCGCIYSERDRYAPKRKEERK
ncbi:MAG TPA: epoxyqueuosine reductase QueH [Bacillota bacterium]|nr:epoxyqueuosine reductase QueH [Bacillota bacterium]HOR85897.1 epoxyqueuosine reductase QueH [Bacillota bacterium]HPL54036.1 epoxyqueuosine reductase QueH [Bacillota bacterium]